MLQGSESYLWAQMETRHSKLPLKFIRLLSLQRLSNLKPYMFIASMTGAQVGQMRSTDSLNMEL